VETPQYGGTLNVPITSDITDFDTVSVYPMYFSNMIYDKLYLGDITIPESEWGFNGIYCPPLAITGNLVERWEEPDATTLIMHLRQDVKFQNTPPVNGRDLVADDVVYSLERLCGSSYASSVGYDYLFQSVKALDRYTVEFKYDLSRYHYQGWYGSLATGNTWIVPREVVEQYGDLKDPTVQVGSGPYVLEDYVPGSSLAFTKNPYYWQMDERYPENRLPYIQNVNFLIISDVSTRLAGLRTGKIDKLTDTTVVQFYQAETLMKTNPELKYRELLPETRSSVSVKCDVTPFNDIRVRHALSMAVDRQSIIDKYYKGHAVFTAFPVSPGWTDVYIPPEEWPEDIRAIYEYNPTRAKQLLAEAGYPDGFKMEVQETSTLTDQIEVLQLLKGYFAAIGVDMDIKIMEFAAYITQRYRHTYPQASAGVGGVASPYFAFTWYYQPSEAFRVYNVGKVTDPVYNEKYEELFAAYAQPDDVRKALFNDLYMYVLEQAYSVDLPYPNNFIFWQPWLKGGYWGQVGLTYYSSGDLYKRLWLDLDLKEELTGSR